MSQELMPAEKVYQPNGMELPTDLGDRLTLTQKLRVMVLDDLTKGGTQLPTNDDSLKMMLEVAKALDITTLGEMRAKVDSQLADSDSLVAQVILQLASNRNNPLLAQRVPPTATRVIPPSPELDDKLDLVPDECHIGTQTLTFDDFRERFGKK